MIDPHQHLLKGYNIFCCHRVALLVVHICLCLNLKLALFCSTLPVALLVVNLSPSQYFLLCFALHLFSLCPLFLLTCVHCLNNSCFVFLNPSSHSVRCKVVSGSSLITVISLLTPLSFTSPSNKLHC